MTKEGEVRVRQVNTYKRNWLGRRVWVDSYQYLQQFRDGEWRELDIHVEEVDL